MANLTALITKDYDLVTTSHHEAGHAIIALINFIKVKNVYVFHNKVNNRVEGLCQYFLVKEYENIIDKDLFYKIVKNEINVKYAGLISERILFNKISGAKKTPMYLQNGATQDTLEAATLIKSISTISAGKNRSIFKTKIINKTIKNINKYWNDVVLIAHALFNKKDLFYKDIKKILIKKSINKEFWKDQFEKIDYIFKSKNNVQEQYLKLLL